MADSPQISHEQAVAAVYNPSTPPEWLAHIATHYYDLHPAVRQHPQAYDSLREWMGAVAPVAAPQVFHPDPVSPAAQQSVFQPGPVDSIAQQPVFQPGYASPMAQPVMSRPIQASPVASYEAMTPPRRPSGKRVALIAGLTVVALAMAGTGAIAAYQKFLGPDGGVADSAQALPATTFAMVELSIEPSTQQKLALGKMWGNLDGLTTLMEESEEDAKLVGDTGTELRPYVWNALIEEIGVDTSLKYDKDVAPWLGGRIAIGVVGSAKTVEESLVIAIECKDEKRGLAAVNQLIADIDDAAIQGLHVEARNGFVVITSASLDLDAAYEYGVLADQEDFSSVIDELGSRGLASYWMNNYGAAHAISRWMGDLMSQDDAATALAKIDKNAAQASVLRALDNGLEIQTRATADGAAPTASDAAGAGAQLGSLPDTTAMAMSVQNVGDIVDTALSTDVLYGGLSQSVAGMLLPYAGMFGSGIDSSPSYVEEARASAEDALGLSIPDGINEVFGGGLILAVDQDLNCNFSFDGSDPGSCDNPNIAALVATDDASRVVSTVEGWGDGEVKGLLNDAGIESTVSDDGSLVSWGTGSYARGLVDSRTAALSSLPAFASALPDRDKATAAMYVSIPGVVKIAEDMEGELDRDGKLVFDDFAAVGLTSYTDPSGVTTSRMRIILSD